MPVETLHPLYYGHEKKAQRVRDAVSGTDAIKSRGTTYLKHPLEEYDTLTGDQKTIADARYDAYKARAVWLGVTKRTHDGLLGAVFRKEPEIDLPAAIAYMEDDADGSGGSLIQFAKVATSRVVQAGAHGVLVDYPEAADGLTREQTRGLRATLRNYDSESIINWRREGEVLTLVVLREYFEIDVDEFERKWEEQHRVLRLEEGVYTQQVYRYGSPAGEKTEPRMANGNRWDRIPFAWLGALTNDENPDSPLLLDIADLNIAHYANSADLEESAFLSGQPMIHVDIGETTTDAWKELNPNGIQVGSRRGVQTQGGSMSMVQAEERNLLLALMELKQSQMLSIGARLLTNGGQNETAEAVRARSGAETANLSTVAHNVSDGIRQCLEWAMQFMGGTGEPVFELSQSFYPEEMSPEQFMALIQGLDRGVIAQQDVRAWGRKTGIIETDRTDEDIDADVQAGGTSLGAL